MSPFRLLSYISQRENLPLPVNRVAPEQMSFDLVRPPVSIESNLEPLLEKHVIPARQRILVIWSILKPEHGDVLSSFPVHTLVLIEATLGGSGHHLINLLWVHATTQTAGREL